MLSDKINKLHSELNKIFEYRNCIFPQRDENNTKKMEKLLYQFTLALKELKKAEWEPNEELSESATRFMKNAVFICGYMKSGTTLLLELLDGHPEIVAMPGDSHMVHLYKQHSKMNPPEPSWDVYWISRIVNPKGQRPFWILGEHYRPYLDLLYYLDYWFERHSSLNENPFLVALLAFYCANPRRPPTPKFWIEKTPNNEMRIDQILKLIPTARFLHILRDPRPNMASLKRLYSLRGWTWDARRIAKSIQRQMEAGFLNQKRLGTDRYYILRYEDLVRNTKHEMEKVAEFMGLSFRQSMLHPTVNGLPSTSNSMYQSRQRMGEVVKESRAYWLEELTHYEREMIIANLYPVMKKLCYTSDIPVKNYFIAKFNHMIASLLSG